MEAKRFHRLLGCACALYFIGSAAVAQAQDAELPFVPVLTIGSTALVNDGVTANADGSFTVLGNQQGGSVNGQPVWDLTWNLTLNQDPSIAGALTLTNLTTTTRTFNLAFALPITPAFSPSLFGGSIDRHAYGCQRRPVRDARADRRQPVYLSRHDRRRHGVVTARGQCLLLRQQRRLHRDRHG